jgi:uncharacterized membrane protein
MGKARLEAFSDGVIAIIITIMVLELKVPHGDGLATLIPLLPVFFSYVLSFIFVGIYWTNHHHLLHTVRRVTASILWANLHLLFWLSLVPFVTGWLGENHFGPLPAMLYGVVMLCAAIAYTILQRAIITHDSGGAVLKQAVGADKKGKLSLLLYVIGVSVALWHPWIAMACYLLVSLIWLIPDRRIERALTSKES